MKNLPTTVIVTSGDDGSPAEDILQHEDHFLLAQVDIENRDIYLDFSSRESMYEFAKELLREAVFGTREQMEFYPLLVDGHSLVVNGARMAEGSSRIFVSYSDRDLGE